MTTMTQIDTGSGLTAILARQRAAFLRDGPPSLAERKRDLNKLKQAILAREEAFVAALDADFGHRSREETMLFDIGSTVSAINYLLSNRRALDAPRAPRRGDGLPPGLEPRHLPAARRDRHRVALELSGRARLDPARHGARRRQSRHAEAVRVRAGDDRSSRLDARRNLRRGPGRRGHRRREGGSRVLEPARSTISCSPAAPRSASPSCARQAENLVPVTLELGGKSPVIVDRGFSSGDRGASHRLWQAGQWRPDLRRPRLCPRARGRD